jgi:DNA-binding NarL/FixJ family response regulator
MEVALVPKIRVVIVDDSRTIQAMLDQIFSNMHECEVVGIGGSVEEGLSLVGSVFPDIITIDLAMPDVDGLELLNALGQRKSLYKVVVASNLDSDVMLKRKLKMLGADIYFDKRSIMSNPDGFRTKVRAMLATAKHAARRSDCAKNSRPGPDAIVEPLSYPVAVDEAERLTSLLSLQLNNAERVGQFDLVTGHLCAVTDFPVCLMTFIDRETQWIKSSYGLKVQQTPRSYAFCNHTICNDDVFAVPNAINDDRFARNPLVVGDPGIRSYFGHPILSPSGARIGALSLIDIKPRQPNAATLQNLRGMAAIASSMIAARAANDAQAAAR